MFLLGQYEGMNSVFDKMPLFGLQNRPSGRQRWGKSISERFDNALFCPLRDDFLSVLDESESHFCKATFQAEQDTVQAKAFSINGRLCMISTAAKVLPSLEVSRVWPRLSRCPVDSVNAKANLKRTPYTSLCGEGEGKLIQDAEMKWQTRRK